MLWLEGNNDRPDRDDYHRKGEAYKLVGRNGQAYG